MTTIVWLTDSTWPACVDAAADQPDDQLVLLHVIDPTVSRRPRRPGGLLGRGIRRRPRGAQTLVEAQTALLDAAEKRLDRPARRLARTGRVEREVVAARADADLLVLARDGDHARLGPRSLGRATRFVLDHAPCRVLLVWPDEPPSLATLPALPPATRRRDAQRRATRRRATRQRAARQRAARPTLPTAATGTAARAPIRLIRSEAGQASVRCGLTGVALGRSGSPAGPARV